MQNREELGQKVTIGVLKTCVARGGKNIIFRMGGGNKYRFLTRIQTPAIAGYRLDGQNRWALEGLSVNTLDIDTYYKHRWALIRYFVISLPLVTIVSQRWLVSLSIVSNE